MSKPQSKILGELAEERMRKFFRGQKVHGMDEVDFETSKAYYEVKSCNLFNLSRNSNYLLNERWKNGESFQVGRFKINLENHLKLKESALKNNKFAKYIFVIRIGNQMVFKVWCWKSVELLLSKKNTKGDMAQIMAHKIF